MGNCCKKVKNFIKKCDNFGTFVTFRINNEIEYKSLIGGITTILFLILSITYSIYVGIPFITRQNIEFIYSNKIIESQPFINLTDIKFNLGFGIQYQEDAKTAIYDAGKYFNFSIKIKEWIGVDEIYEYPFGLKKCTHSDFFDLVNSSFDMNGVGGMLCPILNESVNFTLDGLYTDYYYKFIELEVRLTEYGMNNLEEVRYFMQHNPIEMDIYFLDTAIHYQNRSKPLPVYINYLVKGLDLNFIKTSEILLSTIEFTNDENLFFTNENTYIRATFDKNEDSFHLISSRADLNENLVGKYILKVSSKVLCLSRKYQKLPSFIADLTGILEEILLVTLFLINVMERQAINNKLIHKMLKIKGSKNYDVDYFLTVFNRDKLNNEVMSLIRRSNFQIERSSTGKVYSKRKSIMTLLDNKKFGYRPKSKYQSDINPYNSQKLNNYFNYNNNIKNNANDNNINVKPIQRDIIQLLNSPKKNPSENIRNPNYSISSIPSLDIENYGRKKREISSSESLSSSSNMNISNNNNNLNSNNQSISNEQSNTHDNNIQTERQLITTNMNLNTENNINENNPSKQVIFKIDNPTSKNDENIIKEAEKDFAKIGVVSAVYTSFCYWSNKYQKRKFELLQKAENKIHYYLEVFNYIKGMQEIDLLKYCIFDQEQIELIDYLAKPPLKTNKKEITAIYKEFENGQVSFGKIGKKEIDKVYNAYNSIRNKDDITFEDLKLLRLINAEAQLLN